MKQVPDEISELVRLSNEMLLKDVRERHRRLTNPTRAERLADWMDRYAHVLFAVSLGILFGSILFLCIRKGYF